MDGPILHRLDVPLDPDEARMVTATLVVISYIRADGSPGYFVHAKSDPPQAGTWFLGMTVRAQHEILGWT